MHQRRFEVRTTGRGSTDITGTVQDIVRATGIEQGLCHVFNHHTSASLMLCENADPVVHRDLEAWMNRAVPDGDAIFEHTAEGPDDMPAHVRTVLTHSDLLIPVTAARCALGTWQGIYLWEHRRAPHTRAITVTVTGD